ncbi:MAG: hypothetical protein LBN27_04175 [Prevotellaceae bacterium]|jgi:hypothetical protein|nr:hypothetical protein [Prevotellaceae bacterium]
MGKKQKQKQKLYQSSVKPSQDNEKKTVLDYLLLIIIVFLALAFLISSFFNAYNGYEWAKGWGFYEWFLEIQK